MKKVLFAMVIATAAMAVTALAGHGPGCACCRKAKVGDKAAGCPASTNAPACTNAPVSTTAPVVAQPVK